MFMESNSNRPTDETLWSLVLDGDGDAFGLVFDRYWPRVLTYSRHLLGSATEAEDIAAMVFLEAWRRQTRVRMSDGALAGWLMVTTNNIARNQLRSRWRYQGMLRTLPPASEAEDPGDAVENSLDARAQALNLHAAFRRLSPHDQDVLTACIVQELPMAEAAVLLQVPVGTVKSRLSRAKRHLAEMLDPELPVSFAVEEKS